MSPAVMGAAGGLALLGIILAVVSSVVVGIVLIVIAAILFAGFARS